MGPVVFTGGVSMGLSCLNGAVAMGPCCSDGAVLNGSMEPFQLFPPMLCCRLPRMLCQTTSPRRTAPSPKWVPVVIGVAHYQSGAPASSERSEDLQLLLITLQPAEVCEVFVMLPLASI